MRTPLDFVSRKEWYMSLLWIYYNELLRRLHLPSDRHCHGLPIDHIPTINFPEWTIGLEICSSILTIIYSAFFLLGWNFYFPSRTEQILWRATSIATLSIAVAAVVCAAMSHHFIMSGWTDKRTELPEADTDASLSSWYRKLSRSLQTFRNISPEKDPALSIPLRVLMASHGGVLLYIGSRLLIVVEDIISLRKLPSTAFQTVDWSQYIPHL